MVDTPKIRRKTIKKKKVKRKVNSTTPETVTEQLSTPPVPDWLKGKPNDKVRRLMNKPVERLSDKARTDTKSIKRKKIERVRLDSSGVRKKKKKISTKSTGTSGKPSLPAVPIDDKKFKLRTATDIRKYARETGLLPHEIMLQIARTGKIEHHGVIVNLDMEIRMDAIKSSMPYFAPKVNPVDDMSDPSARDTMLFQMFAPEMIKRLSNDEIKVFEHMLKKIMSRDDAVDVDPRDREAIDKIKGEVIDVEVEEENDGNESFSDIL